MPRIRSERPAFDLHYPHMAEQAHADKYVGPFSGNHGSDAPAAPSEQLAAVMNDDAISKGDPKNPN